MKAYTLHDNVGRTLISLVIFLKLQGNNLLENVILYYIGFGGTNNGSTLICEPTSYTWDSYN